MTTTTEIQRHAGNGLAPRGPALPAMVTDEHRDILRQMIDRHATPAQVEMLILVCNRYGLDPLLSHAVLITGKVFVTHKGLMHVAYASGQLDGLSTAYGKDDIGEFSETTVWRKDMGRPFVGRIYIHEYANNNPVWKSCRHGMAAKTSESFTMRRAFDVALTSQEEMGRSEELEGEYGAPDEDRRLTRDGTPRAERTPPQERNPAPQQRAQERPPAGRPPAQEMVCEECGKALTPGQAAISRNKHGRELCPFHQQGGRPRADTPAPAEGAGEFPEEERGRNDRWGAGDTHDPFAGDDFEALTQDGPALMEVAQDAGKGHGD